MHNFWNQNGMNFQIILMIFQLEGVYYVLIKIFVICLTKIKALFDPQGTSSAQNVFLLNILQF